MKPEGLTVPQARESPTFHGTIAEFKRFTGAQWRVIVQTISRNHKAEVGSCQFCGTLEGPFDAAHIAGRKRTTILHELLGSTESSEIVHVDLRAFEAAFRSEHSPVEKSLLVLCRECHAAYDRPNSTPDNDDEPVLEKPSSIRPGILPITLEPRGTAEFRSELLRTRRAIMRVTHDDGRTVERSWNARKLVETSNVLGNLRSRPEFRQGAWRESGIVSLHVRVVDGLDW